MPGLPMSPGLKIPISSSGQEESTTPMPTTDKDPKEEKEADDCALSQEVYIAASRPSRGWCSRSRTCVSPHVIQRTPEALSARPVHCSSSANQNQIQINSIMMFEKHPSPGGISKEEEEETLISEEEMPFEDNPRDETYKPLLERETPEPRENQGR
ncbi:E3 ubiquitin-protein ligase ZFP91-like [Trachypithecus francoisi]|uniref:E3 ubiquitin-protein ligase ZFP91-like n=1 Tax=Trachypithecus francoisi TaxID=54180 RepID=UPI00141B0224|nr:E3 ubiquitin-protein ligase ZFP91-like [Trachypithecus francoisi]